MLKSCLVNYNYDPEWILTYPELEVTIYDRSDDGIERDLTKYGRVIRTENKGNVDFDKLVWLTENYYNLPDVFLWGKTNLFKFVEESTFKEALEKREFKPLLKPDHKSYGDKFGVVSQYTGGMYQERADSWMFNTKATVLDNQGKFHSWQHWCIEFQLPMEHFIPFAPGGNYILTKERVHRYGIDYYERMLSTLPYAQNPVEAHCAERSYYYLWRT